jgi:hypothetical protein
LTVRRIECSCYTIRFVEKHGRNLRRNEEIIEVVSVDVRLDLLPPKVKILFTELLCYTKSEMEIGFAIAVVFLERMQRRRA